MERRDRLYGRDESEFEEIVSEYRSASVLTEAAALIGLSTAALFAVAWGLILPIYGLIYLFSDK